MGKNRVIKNYIYNLIYEAFLIIIPIAVTPYVARVLGENGSGQYSYAFSINTYFTLFASLGFSYYAQRLIASHQGDKKKQSIDFWEIILARLIPTLISLVVYYVPICLNLYGSNYNLLMIILSINVIAIIFDIAFFFQGNEEFAIIVIRSILIKIVSIVCIFLFVKDKSDLGIYTFIQAATVFLSNISLWLCLRKRVVRVSINELNPIKHIPATLILFIPTIATSVYTSLDKTLIGLITHMDSENGNYDYSEKLVKMAMTLLTSLGTVMTPRNSKKIADGDIEGVKKNIYASCNFVFFLGIPLVFGIIAVADNFIPWYLGEGYDKAAMLMKIMSPIIIIIGLSNVFGRQYLIPSKRDKEFTTAVIAGATINFILNIILISKLYSYGAAIATVIAELVVTMVMLFFVRKDIRFGTVICESWKEIISGLIMFGVCTLLGNSLLPSIINTIIIITIGIIVYCSSVVLLKDNFAIQLINTLINRKKGE